MAEAGVAHLLKKLDSLVTMIKEESKLFDRVKQEIKHLMDELPWMRKYVREADTKLYADDPEIHQIIDLTFETEDIVDDFALKVLRHQRQKKDLGALRFFKIKFLKRFILRIRELHEFKDKIKAINTMSDKISTYRAKYPMGRQHASTCLPVKRTPIVEELDVVGMENSIQQVTSLLVPNNSSRRTVVSIVGMGGLGKTTLATKLYKDTCVKRYFDVFAWVYVSQESEVADLLLSIIRQVTKGNLNDPTVEWDEGALRMKLYNFLKQRHNKRYLIVLDDVWHTDTWKHLDPAFPDTNNGSRILLTSRNLQVARLADPSHNNIHQLRLLDKRESWDLFQKKNFPLGGQCPPEFVEIGKKIVDKCRGLPLGIVVLGGLLLTKDRTLAAWSKVHDSVNWELTHGDQSYLCSGILAFSYYDIMPYYLKPCFMTIGLFPEDHEIRASKLFDLWIAEGFVHKEGEKTLEDTAEDYLEQLVHRSLIKIESWRYDGRVKACRIHDLLRDLANEKSEKLSNTRRLSSRQYLSQFRSSRTRTLMCFENQMMGNELFLKYICRNLKLLTVLDISSITHNATIPLSCSADNNTQILECIVKLVNLQTLIIQGKCTYMPKIWRLHQLRRLEVQFMELYHKAPSNYHLGIHNLTNLHTLSISYGCWMKDVRWDELKMLRKLSITNFGYLRCTKESLDSIALVTSLQNLKLLFGGELPLVTQFARHTNLTKLHIRGPLPVFLFPSNLVKLVLSSINRPDIELMAALGNLKDLKFLSFLPSSCTGKTITFSAGKFPRLQSLEIAGLPNLRELVVEEGALTSLTHLVIRSCDLRKLPERLGQMQLQELQLHNMHRQLINGLKENVGDNWDQIKHIPSVLIRT
ncbi:hypothetical protein MKW98_003668 [Papaver atlanticum]|uniref:Uncharacterized protein n=1 Tax=Papaver atlanticum TaxID=357466 RepID=A0AAD4SJ42_9MAGN|nr:hypothetical protein MKW98_003668 [Papaver atlanticum]